MNDAKKCKGIGKAKGFGGCGCLSNLRTYGLCPSCLKDWSKTDEGFELYVKPRLIPKAKVKVYKDKQSKDKKSKAEAKTSGELNGELQRKINKIARLIDLSNSRSCISCSHGEDENWTRQVHGAHFHDVGGNNTIRFHLDNIHASCSVCNVYSSNHKKDYRAKLIKRYGIEYLEFVESLKQTKAIKMSIADYARANKEALSIVRDISSGINITRSEANKRLGIYDIY